MGRAVITGPSIWLAALPEVIPQADGCRHAVVERLPQADGADYATAERGLMNSLGGIPIGRPTKPRFTARGRYYRHGVQDRWRDRFQPFDTSRVRISPDPEAPTVGPAGPLIEVDLPAEEVSGTAHFELKRSFVRFAVSPSGK
jgi:hypothetical protein